jgi:hypothetical protein
MFRGAVTGAAVAAAALFVLFVLFVVGSLFGPGGIFILGILAIGAGAGVAWTVPL